MQYAGNIGGGNSSTLAILGEIQKLKNGMNDLLYLGSASAMVDSVESNAMTNITFDIPVVEGYEPLIALYQTNGNTSLILPMSTAAVINNKKAGFSVRNTHTAAIKNVVFYILVLYVKKGELA